VRCAQQLDLRVCGWGVVIFAVKKWLVEIFFSNAAMVLFLRSVKVENFWKYTRLFLRL